MVLILCGTGGELPRNVRIISSTLAKNRHKGLRGGWGGWSREKLNRVVTCGVKLSKFVQRWEKFKTGVYESIFMIDRSTHGKS